MWEREGDLQRCGLSYIYSKVLMKARFYNTEAVTSYYGVLVTSQSEQEKMKRYRIASSRGKEEHLGHPWEAFCNFCFWKLYTSLYMKWFKKVGAR
jgi:hypothetical protein